MKIVIALLFLATPALAEPLAVQIIDVAGEQVYVDRGEDAGLRLGTRVTIDGIELVVVELNAKTAALRIDPATAPTQRGTKPLSIGTSGTAELVAKRAPRDPAMFRDQWPTAKPPASDEKPAPIPLGGREDGNGRITLVGSMFGATGDAGSAAAAEARVIASFDDLGGTPIGFELDAAFRRFDTDWDRAGHIPIFVRRGLVRYRRAIALGRLELAAAGVGMLDGARVATRVGNLELAAFGGLVPDPISGEPDSDASRFGAEAVWDDATAAWSPRVVVAAHGSTFDGGLDERRLSIAASATHDRTWLDGWAEAQSFASDNPFGAKSIELVGAGASASWRTRGRYVSAGATYLVPERSLRLAAILPPSWICGRDATGMCSGGDRWIAATASTGVHDDRWSVDATASVGHTTNLWRDAGLGSVVDASGYVRGEVAASDRFRVFLAPSAGKTAFSTMLAVEAGGRLVTERVEASLAYRPELLEDGPFERVTLHGLVGDLRIGATDAVDLAVSTLATLGDERTVIAALVVVARRAR